jgi:hypothetical protein
MDASSRMPHAKAVASCTMSTAQDVAEDDRYAARGPSRPRRRDDDAPRRPRTSAESEPVAVEAWVRFPEHPIKVDGRAVAWTRRAVWVEFTMFSGATFRAWVWASAVERKGATKPPPAERE